MIDDACVAIALILRVRVIERLYMYPFLIESLKVASIISCTISMSWHTGQVLSMHDERIIGRFLTSKGTAQVATVHWRCIHITVKCPNVGCFLPVIHRVSLYILFQDDGMEKDSPADITFADT